MKGIILTGDAGMVTKAMIGDSPVIGARCDIVDGAPGRPGIELPDGAVLFSAGA